MEGIISRAGETERKSDKKMDSDDINKFVNNNGADDNELISSHAIDDSSIITQRDSGNENLNNEKSKIVKTAKSSLGVDSVVKKKNKPNLSTRIEANN